MRTSRYVRWLPVAAALACGGEPPTTPTPPVVRVAISAPETAGLPGWTVQLSATAYDSTGTVVTAARFKWEAENPHRATVDSSGLVTFLPEAGDVMLIATETTSGFADTVLMRSAQVGDIRWAVKLDWPLPLSGGPALAPDGSIWLLGRNPDSVFNAATGVPGRIYHLDPHGRELCQADLSRVQENFPIVTPKGDVWVTGQMIYHVSPTCAIEASLRSQTPLADFLGGALGPDGSLYASEGFNLIAYNPDFTERWRSRADSIHAGWIQPPVVAGDRVYAKLEEDSLFAFDGTSGQVLWGAPELDTTVFSQPVAVGAGPAVANGQVLLPDATVLAAYDTNGTRRWVTPSIGGIGVSEPVVLDDGQIVNQVQGGIVARDGTTGAELWMHQDGAAHWYGFYGGPALADSNIIYAAAASGLYAYNADGTVRWVAHTVPGDSAWFQGSPAIGPDGTIYSWGKYYVYAVFGTHPPDPNSPWPMWRHDAQRTGDADR